MNINAGPAPTGTPSLVQVQDAIRQTSVARKALEAALTTIPGDKHLLASQAALTKAVASLTKQEAALSKATRDAAKKTAPPELLKAARKVEKLLKDRLSDPSTLEVIPWTKNTFTPGVVEYQVVFRIPKAHLEGVRTFYDGKGYDRVLSCFVASAPLDKFNTDYHQPGKVRAKDAMGNLVDFKDAAAFVNLFADGLRGWAGIKGEGEANVARATLAPKIRDALNSGLRRVSSIDTEEAKISGLHVSASYRSHLPKEGERAVGEHDYERMVDDEISQAKKVFEPLLAPFKSSIANVSYSDGEKSWVYIDVTLK